MDINLIKNGDIVLGKDCQEGQNYICLGDDQFCRCGSLLLNHNLLVGYSIKIKGDVVLKRKDTGGNELFFEKGLGDLISFGITTHGKNWDILKSPVIDIKGVEENGYLMGFLLPPEPWQVFFFVNQLISLNGVELLEVDSVGQDVDRKMEPAEPSEGSNK